MLKFLITVNSFIAVLFRLRKRKSFKEKKIILVRSDKITKQHYFSKLEI